MAFNFNMKGGWWLCAHDLRRVQADVQGTAQEAALVQAHNPKTERMV